MHEEDDFLGGLGVAGVEAAVHGRTSVALPHATPVRVPLLQVQARHRVCSQIFQLNFSFIV